ncbi:hypothetical protein SAMN06309944_2425 [Micrococcales bacterium KH10]|nr:hypothetical protein SAMN06309944_2425 [Micrococcales bacterium KH10]
MHNCRASKALTAVAITATAVLASTRLLQHSRQQFKPDQEHRRLTLSTRQNEPRAHSARALFTAAT